MAEITKMQLADWLDDLTVRFLLNLPASELSSVPRLCFQVEEAQWFYEDFIRPAAAAVDITLPSLPLKPFFLLLFQHCPLLSGFTDEQHLAAYEEFLAYKVRVPVRGAILMDDDMEKVLLVKGWKKNASWSFPRGKINKDEKDLDCAIREVYEETGFDLREAGLVCANEDEVKYIDITMREQHMRLFVFRGVQEGTYFEPKTRKEISKIAWYNIRDLPGFTKRKHVAAHGPEYADATGQANKFYMVAPFLGPLKRWIIQQRRKDATMIQQREPQHLSVGSGLTPQPGTEDEGEVDDYHEETPERVLSTEDRSEQLRRLMGVVASVPEQQSPTPAVAAVPQPNDLLALVHGGPKPTTSAGPAPHTPLEQIQPFPPRQPKSPHPHHPRHPSMGYQQPVPRFPIDPQRPYHQVQQQPQEPLTLPGISDSGPSAFPRGQQPHFPPIPSPLAHPQQFQQQQSIQHAELATPMSNNFSHQNGMPFHAAQPPQVHSFMALPDQYNYHQASDAFAAQGLQGAIKIGPSVPNAEHLPMPKLSAHTMHLLDAFKSGSKPAAALTDVSGHTPRQPSTHQAALLDLFRKPSAPPPSTQTADLSSPRPTAATEKPSGLRERRPTLNEITRTLPKAKAKSPISPELPSLPQSSLPPTEAIVERPKSRQLYDPSNPKQSERAPVGSTRAVDVQPAPPTKILQRPPSSHTLRMQQRDTHKAKYSATPPDWDQAAKGPENGHPTPQFTILARPDSSRASRSPRMPSSPLRKETPKSTFQTQVLKRPEVEDASSSSGLSGTNGMAGSDERRTQLLSLFGKRPASSVPSPSLQAKQQQTPAVEMTTNDAEKRKKPQLNLLSSAQALATETPPPAPQLLPERNSSRQAVNKPQQNVLLELFNKPASSTQNSPGTPMSPFTLGTPAQNHGPGLEKRQTTLVLQGESRTRLGTMASVLSNSGGAEKGIRTPVEAKGFLMDYLNGVVQKERERGAP